MYLGIDVILIFISMILNFFLAGLIFFHDPKNRVHRFLALVILFIGLWNASAFMSYHHNYRVALASLYFTLIFAIFIPSFYLAFAKAFLYPSERFSRIFIFALIFPLIVFLPFSWGDFSVPGLSLTSTGWWRPSLGLLYYPFTVYFLLYFSYSIRLFVKTLSKETDNNKRKQIIMIVVGTIFSTTIGILFSSILPMVNKYFNFDFSSPSSLGFTILVTWAILRYRFIGMKVVIRKSLITFSLVTIILALTATLLLLFERFSQSFFTMSEKTSFAVTVVLISFLFPLLHHFVSRIIHRWLDDDVIDFGEVVDLDSKSWLKKSELQQYVFALSKELEQKLYVPSVLLLVADPDFQTYASVYPKQFTVRFKFEHPLMRFIKDLDRVFEIEKLKKFISTKPVNECQHLQRFYSLLSKHRTALVAPIESQGDMLGIAFIPKKIDNSPFSDADFSYLILLFDEVYSTLHSLLKGKDDAQSQFIFPDKGSDTIH